MTRKDAGGELKPREWRINRHLNAIGPTIHSYAPSLHLGEVYVNVIEKSAYDELLKRIKILEAENENMLSDFTDVLLGDFVNLR